MYIENSQLKKYIIIWLFAMCIIVSIMIIVGGLTRLTDSGLSITQWQLFSGSIPPLNELQWNKYFDLYKKIPEYKLQNFSMSLDEFKVIFWWEFIHRFLGRLIGISFLIPLIFFSIKLGFNKTKNLFFIFFLICFQGFIGWYMVSSGLIDRVDVSHYRLSLHLFLAFVILCLIFWQFLDLINLNFPSNKINFFLPIFFLFLIFLQIIIGAFVSGMDAGMIYNSWPLMGSTYFPDDNLLIDFFKFSAFNQPSLVQFMHRNLAYLIFVIYIAIFVYTYLKNLREFFNVIYFLGILLSLQIILGIFTLLSGAQIFLASMHQISSIFLVLSTVYLVFINYKTNQQL
ncbi:COX15/CtaA family protein [Candidatus Pelagibacter sp.]|nr:COX15/CtaA family protein [Candidatus Pelagibacter sp.]